MHEESSPSSSMVIAQNLLSLQKKFSELNTLKVTDNEFIVNGDKIELDIVNFNPNFLQKKINFNELLIGLFEIENNLKFKVFEDEINNQSVQNVVLKFSSFENLSNSLSEIIKFENISIKKVFKDDNSNSLHLYISVLRDEN